MLVTAQTALAPNALITGMNADLALLLGTKMMSLALIGMSWFRPRITAPTSIGISRFWPAASSRNITARPGEAVGIMPWAREMAWRSVVPSLSGNDPGAFTWPATKKTSDGGM